MKSIWTLLCCLALAASLTACKSGAPAPAEDEAPKSEAPAEEAKPEAEAAPAEAAAAPAKPDAPLFAARKEPSETV